MLNKVKRCERKIRKTLTKVVNITLTKNGNLRGEVVLNFYYDNKVTKKYDVVSRYFWILFKHTGKKDLLFDVKYWMDQSNDLHMGARRILQT